MARSMDSATAAAIILPSLWLAWFVRMDWTGDPVYVNSTLTDITFAGGSGYDPAIVGFDFLGIGNIGSIDPVTDSIDGSETLNLTLPGIQLGSDYLKQIMTNADLWQRRSAYIWVATFDGNGALVGKPCRVKTARMDQLNIVVDPDSQTGTITVSLESQQSYNGGALSSRYSEQKLLIDSTDTSQDFTSDLANKVAQIGTPSAPSSGQTSSSLATQNAGIFKQTGNSFQGGVNL